MTPMQEDRQHEMIVYLAPGNTNNLEVALGINWSSDFPMHSVSPLIVLNFWLFKGLVQYCTELLFCCCMLIEEQAIGNSVLLKSLLFGQQFINLISWCGSILPLIYIIQLTTEPQHKHVQNLEKATDLFQIINEIPYLFD